MNKVFLIGDSIRMGYDKYVKMAFEDVAEVLYPNENCRFASYVLRYLNMWKQSMEFGDDIDLVHWNAGLWDCLRMIDGKPHTDIKVYGDYIERICKCMPYYFPRAKFIFATSTPVQEHLFKELKRYNKDIEAYNKVAMEIVTKHGHSVNDLYPLVENMPVEYYSDLTHLYTKGGTKLLADAVISSIEKELNINANPLDYDELFKDKEEIVGI
ncbi:MAG: SGNH/GDSL hydrolase family protein [Ruminococcaceae bacterium]|nr:SGNH/GDSL hydrolase family protein [Oscillospiraceae bacterium]